MSKLSRFLNSYLELPKRTILLYAVVLASIVLGIYFLPSIRAAQLIGDVNGDGVVNVLDLSALLSHWSTNYAAADLNADGTINVLDLSLLLSHWGQTASASPTHSTSPTPTPTLPAFTPTPSPQPVASQISAYLTNGGTGEIPLCLDNKNNATANNNPVIVNTCSTTSPEQQWSGPADNTIQINGKCLTPQNGSTQNGAAVVIATCNGTTAQQWKRGSVPSVSLNDLVNTASGLCLNVPGITSDTQIYAAPTGVAVNLATCNGSLAEQVWGWNSDGTIVPGGATMGANCGYAYIAYLGFGECYWEAHGLQQQPFTATGYSVTMTQANPTVPVYEHNNTTSHAINEVWAGGGDPGTGGQLNFGNDPGDAIEFGWIKNGDGNPSHIIITYWQNNTWLCDGESLSQAEACGFVSTSSKITPGMAVTAGTTATYKLVYTNSQWQFWYNGTEMGYFPESIWINLGDTSFTSLTLLDVYGEVAVPSEVVSKTQMGNGILGSQPGSTAFANFSLLGSSSAANLLYDGGSQPISTYQYAYDRGNLSPTSFNVGGPGL